MNFPLFIAKRYLFKKKSINIVNIISYVSLFGITIGTASLVLMLSVFNGFEDLILDMYNSFDPHLKITKNKGKTFHSEDIKHLLNNKKEILYFAEVLEEKVLLKNGEKEYIATVKGVSKYYREMTNLDSLIVEGKYFENFKSSNVALVGQGLAFHLSIGVNNIFEQLKVFVPDRGNKTLLNPSTAFKISSVMPTGIFSLQTDYDSKYIITPITFLQQLINKEEISAIEIKLVNKNIMLKMQELLQSELGVEFIVQNQLEQHKFLYKILNSEKLAVFLILVFILLVATFNIIGSLSMLMLDKKKDIQILWNLGAKQKSIQKIFFNEGILLIIIGSILGIFLGLLLAYLQMRFKLIGMGEGNFIIDSYPVAIHYTDLILVELTVLVIGIIASWYPSRILVRKLINQ